MKLRRRGFAIILVAALAGLIFLLGASLVAISQLQSASAIYDQRMRLAREHARASLDMAIAELQDKLGKDTAVSFTADVYRANTTDNFRDAMDANVKQPFWTGTQVETTERTYDYWLVTKPLSSFATLPNPTSATTDYIELVGDGTVNTGVLKVSVPREAITVIGVDGYKASDAKTIGHYAYWVGDLGVKASYALYDKADLVTHDEYSVTQRERLRQLSVSKPQLDIVGLDTNSASGSTLDSSNPMRINSLVNDFQFRDRYGASSESERFLIGLGSDDVESFFHDYTPLSKGLLTNSAGGGFRKDLSTLRSFGSSTVAARYQSFVKLAKQAPSLVSETFPILGESSGRLAVHPVLTQFQLNYAVYLVEQADSTDKSDLYISLESVFELWNPYTIPLAAEKLRFEVSGLPSLAVWLELKGDPSTTVQEWPTLAESGGYESGSIVLSGFAPDFETPAGEGAKTLWRPGEISVFNGQKLEGKSSPFTLVEAAPLENSSTNRASIKLGSVTGRAQNVNQIMMSFWDDSVPVGEERVPVDAAIKVTMYRGSEALAEYSLGSSNRYYLTNLIDPFPFAVGISDFGFGWSVKDKALFDLADYSPVNSDLSEVENISFTLDSGASLNTDLSFDGMKFDGASESRLLGFSSSALDLPLLQLPLQELTSVAQFSGAFGQTMADSKIGKKSSTENSLLDDFFFSTVPSGDATTWDRSTPLAVSGYVPKSGAGLAVLQSKGAKQSAEQLFVHGMFNVHSTSIDAWTALLMGAPSRKIYYGGVDFGDNRYLFFNQPLGGEKIYAKQVEDPVKNTYAAWRASLRENVISLTAVEVRQLASFIVSKIREHVQKSGPFHSISEFVDSNVLQAAIDENYFVPTVDVSSGEKRLNASWITPGSPAEFSQSTILNLIGPYLTVRSDTFLVRAYGDAVDPRDGSRIWARAYCEAVLQRTHEQYDDVINESDSTTDKSKIDRKFEVVAFRWLSPADI